MSGWKTTLELQRLSWFVLDDSVGGWQRASHLATVFCPLLHLKTAEANFVITLMRLLLHEVVEALACARRIELQIGPAPWPRPHGRAPHGGIACADGAPQAWRDRTWEECLACH